MSDPYRGHALCPCCRQPTLDARGDFEICPLCDWEDDGQDDADADAVAGGPNADYSLTEARANFVAHATMYRPTDRDAFASTTCNAIERRRAVERYAQAIASGGDADWAAADAACAAVLASRDTAARPPYRLPLP